MAKQLIPGAVALLLLFTVVRLAQAEPDCPSDINNYYGDCVETDGFDANTDGWEGDPGHATAVAWLVWQNFGIIFQSNSDGGVIAVTSPQGIRAVQKSIWLDRGAYVVTFRAATNEETWRVWESYTPQVDVTLPDGSYRVIGSWTDDTKAREQYASYQTQVLTVTTPGMVAFRFIVFGLNSDRTFFLDHVIIQEVNYDLPGQFTPIPPTFTPAPTSPPQSTPIATPAPVVCVDDHNLDLIPEANRWAYLNDGGDVGQIIGATSFYWRRSQSGVQHVTNVNAPASNSGAAFVPYSAYADVSTRPAIVFTTTTPLPVPFYGFVYGMADSIQAGQIVTAEVWVKDATTWSLAYEQRLNSQNWLQFSYTVTTPSPTYQLAFAVRRSDDPGSGGAYLDRIYLYGHPDLRPNCDGSFPSITIGDNYGVPQPPDSGDVGTTLIFPADKPCPPDLLVPNNFFGPILANLTLWQDEWSAFYPSHNYLGLPEIAQAFTATPAGLMTTIFAVVFDLRLFFTIAGIMFVAESLRAVWSVWMFIKRSIPFLGGG